MIYELNSKNSIPQKQRFLFPQNHGGIIGDVYIHLKPDFYIAKEKIKTIFSDNYKSVSLQVESIIKNNMTTMNSSGIDNAGDYSLIISLTDAAGNTIKDLPAYKFTLDKNKDIAITQKLDLSGTVLWSPETPQLYILKQQLFKEDSLIDKKQKSVAFYQ